MARPKIFDYDSASDETIVTAGVEGFELMQCSFLPSRGLAVFVINEGTIDGSGDGIDTVTRKSTQYNLEDSDFSSWYLANKTVCDDFYRICIEKAAEMAGKTGNVVES